METYIRATGLSCAGAPYDLGVYSVRAIVCSGGGSCQKITDFNGLQFQVSKQHLGCPVPLWDTCTTPTGWTTGQTGMSCPLCQRVSGDAGCGVGDGKVSCEPQRAGNAQLRYAAGGVGGDGLPGSTGPTGWRTILGRFWSHDFAERIVVDPDLSHVFLLTRYGSFREFSNLASGTGLRLYQTNAPSDEFRRLYYDTATDGWQLQSLDGRTDYFLSSGLWDKTGSAQDPSHFIDGTYNGSNQLESVSFPDGRQDTFTYSATSGKLETITTVPVAGSGTLPRTWTLTWSSDELISVVRPDGTTWQFNYDPTRPGYLTRIDLLSAAEGRVMAGFSYLAGTNVVEKSWRGDPLFTGPNAVDKVTYSYTNPSLPTAITVTRVVRETPLSPTFDQVTTYNIGRDTVSSKPKVTSIQGSCPTCGLSPVTTFAYTGTNSMLASSMTDAKATRTDYTYDTNGRMLTKVEAANVPALTRTTTYAYQETNFPGLVTKVEVPSTAAACATPRRVSFDYDDTAGRLLTRTIEGCEGADGSGNPLPLPADFKTTAYTPNASGETLTIDPPGFGTADQVSFTYNLPNRNGHVPDTRTDPNPPGASVTTTFVYDGFNRRTEVIEPNGVDPDKVKIVTAYDVLDRAQEVRQKGAGAIPDLVTTYTYTRFKDLFCTKLPEGNGIRYEYDAARRLIAVERGTAVATPDDDDCLEPDQPRERTFYKLDNAGNRIEESLERWNGSAWVSESKTEYVFTCHLDKVTQGAGSATPSVTEHCYDVNDNLEKTWDGNHPKGSNPNTPTQLYEYDELNRLEKVTVGYGTANAAATNYAYTVQDQLASVADAEGNLTTYTTSDRDLMTKEVSPVSGTTVHAYDAHGELLTTTDARNIVTTRTVDAASRVTQATFGPSGSPDPALTTAYAYGSTPAQLDVGRLTSITRNAQAIAYTYDRFGRTLQDGSLVYEYDKNGNRKKITYPGGVAANYGFDFADRPSSLTYEAGGPPATLVNNVTYRALGPLSSLTLGNTLVETRTFDARNFVDSIQAGSRLSWDYTLDAVGNPTSIAGTVNGVSFNPSFGYVDSLYFLSQGNGPWGDRGWTYDKIGNRITFSRTNEPTLNHCYAGAACPGGAGHNPKLQTVTPAPGLGTGGWTFTYDAAGNQAELAEADNEGTTQTTFFDVDDDGRMSAQRTNVTGVARTDLLYDGRGFLRQASLTVTPPGDFIIVTPVYSSDGMLHARTEQRRWSGGTAGNGEDDPTFVTNATDTTLVFYFAGRPVAQLTNESELLFLTTDHLGTPVLATDSTNSTVIWAGALEPFGAVWTAGADNPDTQSIGFTPGYAAGGYKGRGGRGRGGGVLGSPGPPPVSKLAADRIFLRYPGQWVSDAFRVSGTQQDVYYNVNRWVEIGTGRYTTPDPLGLRESLNLFEYAEANPLTNIDPLGLAVLVCSRRAHGILGMLGANHSYFWDDRPPVPLDRRFCGRGPSDHERGPGPGIGNNGDQCVAIPGSDGREDGLMRCCRTERTHGHVTGLWVPWAQDCGTMLQDCTEWPARAGGADLEFPGIPGGRIGRPCNRCPPVRLPDLPPPVPRNQIF
jgi:RHS repeat-associated protein